MATELEIVQLSNGRIITSPELIAILKKQFQDLTKIKIMDALIFLTPKSNEL